jgi:hypothetical protein
MSFDPCNCPLKSQKFVETPTPKMGVHLGVWGFILSHSPTFLGACNVTHRFHSWPTPLSPCIGYEPKAKVATSLNFGYGFEIEFRSEFNSKL